MGRVATPVTVAIALGSNTGDRGAHLQWAADELGRLLANARLSSFFDTAPEGFLDQPRFLNAALVGQTTMPAAALLAELHRLEQVRGRVRTFRNAPRPLDLDLVLYGNVICDDGSLVLPHPRFRARGFVLAPLAEIAPDLMDPVTGATVGELWTALP